MTAFPVSRVDKVASVRARIGWKALTASEYTDDGYVFLSTPNIKGTSIDFEDVNYISEFRYKESPELMLQSGDVLLAKDGSTLGIVALVTDLPRPSTVNGSIAVIRPHGVYPAFLRYVLEGAAVQGEIQRLKDGMGVPHLFQWDIRRLPVPLPPLDVQRRIADFLDDQVARIDQLVGLRAKQSALVGEVFQARIDDLYRAESNPPLRSLLAQDPCYGVLVPDFTEAADGVPLIRINNLLRPGSELDRMPRIAARQSREYRRTMVSTGDVLLSVVGSLDKAAIVPSEWSGANVNRPVARLVPRKGIPSEVIYGWTMTSAYMRDALLATGGGTAQATLNMGDLRRFRVPVPRDVFALAGSVRDLLAWRMAAVAGLVRSTALLLERKRSLITAAVTGEFDVSTASSRATAS